MAKGYMLALLFAFLLFGCTSRQKKIEKQPREVHFSYFEISYKGGWWGGLSFCVDTNKIFFFPHIYPQGITDTIGYGILPDSIFQSIDTTILLVKAQKPGSLNTCDDCAAVAIKVITGPDTIRLLQAGEISPPIMKLINQLESFSNYVKLNYIKILMFTETAGEISPPPSQIPANIRRRGK